MKIYQSIVSKVVNSHALSLVTVDSGSRLAITNHDSLGACHRVVVVYAERCGAHEAEESTDSEEHYPSSAGSE